MKPKELVVYCSLGKGFGIQAGAIFGTKALIVQLTNTDFFGGSGPAAQVALETLSECHLFFEEQRAVLKENLELFMNKTPVINRFHYTQEHPAFAFENSELVNYLEANEIIVTNFKYQSDEDALMSRIVISVAHTKKDIEQLAEVLNSYK